MKKTELPEMLTAKDLEDFLPISRSSVYALLRDPTFPTIKLGRRIIVPRDALLEWLDRNLHRNDGLIESTKNVKEEDDVTVIWMPRTEERTSISD